MIRKLLILSAGLWAGPALSVISAQSVDSLVAKYIQASGGMARHMPHVLSSRPQARNSPLTNWANRSAVTARMALGTG